MRNRRRGCDKYLFQVKINRGSRAKRFTKKFATGSAYVLACAVLCFSTYWTGITAVRKFVFENPHFALAEVIVENKGVITDSQIIHLSGAQLGQDIFTIDLEKLRHNLVIIPMIREVSVQRILPNKLRIEVEERTPVAEVALPSAIGNRSTYYIDRDGITFNALRLSPGVIIEPQIHRSLPVLTGVTSTDFSVHEQMISDGIRHALQLLDALQQSVTSALIDIRQIDVSKSQMLTIRTKQNTLVEFSVDDYSQQVRRLGAVMTWAAQRKRALQHVDLSIDRGVTATFFN